MMKLCLGTVQFGMKYGINNRDGQPSEEACHEMLDIALQNGIDVIDTARAYGTAEIVVGNYIKSRNCKNQVHLISKLRPNVIEPGEKDVYSVVRRELEDTLERLHVSKLEGYLLHTPEYIYDNRIVEALEKLKDEKLVNNIGVSIYNMPEGYEAIKKKMDFVQLPYSVLDQRGYQTGFMKAAKAADMIVFVRSVFLQGLFMMDAKDIPLHIAQSKPYLKYFESLLEKYSIDKVELLLQFVKLTENIDYLVFGVDNVNQLSENIEKFKSCQNVDSRLMEEIRNYFIDVEESIILPSLWSNGKRAE